MKKDEAKRYWTARYEAARNWNDPHWEAQERREHREYVEALRMAIEALSDDAVQGEWTYLSGLKGSYMTISCPICGSTFDDVAEWKYHYCPNCGARMKGGDDTTGESL